MAVEPTQQLSVAELEALATLEERVVSADGGRLKLEWGVLRTRPRGVTRDFLWREDGRLLGFLGLYAFGADRVEIAGMVDPDARRRGIASALLEAALPVCRSHRGDCALLVVPRNSVPGRALALARGAKLEHSEHALLLRERPAQDPPDQRLSLRPATPADFDAVSALMLSGFGHPASDPAELRESERAVTLMVELEGAAIGSVRLSRDGDRGGVYGFVIDAALRGRGIGREVLGRVCQRLFDAGVTSVGLEIAVDNDRALGLYTSLGFTQVATEDYYELGLLVLW